MQGVWRELAGLVLPVACAGCGRPRTELCVECRRVLARDGRGARRVRPRPEPAGLPRVWAGVPYADEARAVLLAHKERGALRLAAPLGAVLAGAVRGLRPGAGALLLVPVPSARRAVAGRGHDPVRRITLAAAADLRRGAGNGVGEGAGARVLAVLRQRRTVADQAGLSARQRLANVAGALEVRGGAERLLTGLPVVLVDDLVTTGATLAEAARAVTAAGGRVTGAAVVAATGSAFPGAFAGGGIRRDSVGDRGKRGRTARGRAAEGYPGK
ncbi:ComF family protein [Streptomyces lydicus]|uniref:ComF family protein n=1 Tax=Streptomyces lydicus TaxID=47763 RepID=UPI0028701AE2|nr:phosphoribosyltransferase family protein [Streptomyces lydicus]